MTGPPPGEPGTEPARAATDGTATAVGRSAAGQRRTARRLLPPALATAVGLFLLLRVLFTAYGALVTVHADPWGPCHTEVAFADWERFPRLEDDPLAFPLLGVWQRWDGCWYIKIASFGYEPGESATAFFPLYPALTRLVGAPLGGSYTLGALLASGIAYVVAVAGLITLVRAEWGRFTGRRAALYLSVFPSAFFLFAPFTEALFLAAVIWAVYGARRHHWLLATIAGACAALTRTHGVLLVLPLAWEAVRWWRTQRWSRHDWLARWPDALPAVIAVAAPLIGFQAFNLYARVALGQTPAEAQGYWGGANFHPPWEVVSAAVRWTIERGDGIELVNVVMLGFSALMLIPIFLKLPLTYGLYALPHVVVIATRILPTPLTSTSRFVLVIFPIFIVLALWGRDERLHTAWLIGSTLFLGLLTYLFLIGDFVA